LRARLSLLVLLVTSGCWSGRYLAQQGIGQLELLRARRPIREVLKDRSVDEETKRRLRLALEARAFGIAQIGLRGGDGFTYFVDSHGAPIAWNVTAAPKCELKPHLNTFPIVGAVPYLGFFHEPDVHAEAARLAALGLDTYVREVAGYSTLGLTTDPIYSSMIEGSDARIVEVVLHEMTHTTVYLPGHADWNESMATLVGIRGAAAFFHARGNAAEAEQVLAEAERVQRYQEEFAAFLEPVARAWRRSTPSPAPAPRS
jgi:predicted aminopeptidase